MKLLSIHAPEKCAKPRGIEDTACRGIPFFYEETEQMLEFVTVSSRRTGSHVHGNWWAVTFSTNSEVGRRQRFIDLVDEYLRYMVDTEKNFFKVLYVDEISEKGKFHVHALVNGSIDGNMAYHSREFKKFNPLLSSSHIHFDRQYSEEDLRKTIQYMLKRSPQIVKHIVYMGNYVRGFFR